MRVIVVVREPEKAWWGDDKAWRGRTGVWQRGGEGKHEPLFDKPKNVPNDYDICLRHCLLLVVNVLMERQSQK